MAKILINTRHLLPNRLEGIGVFTYHVLKHLVAKYPEHHFVFLFDRKPAPEYNFADNVSLDYFAPPARTSVLIKYWNKYSVKKAIQKHQADLYISTDGMTCLKSDIKQIAVVHDLNFIHHPEFLPKRYRTFYQKTFREYVLKADEIITVSNYSKNDIAQAYNIHPDKITVAYNGVSDKFKQIDTAKKIDIQKTHTHGKPFWIYLGSLHQRKNILRMLQAFNSYKEKHKTDLQLVIAGERMFSDEKLESYVKNMPYKHEVLFLGRLDMDELSTVLAASDGLVYVSLFEGFGIPVIEALKCGVPVLISNITSLPEVGGDVAHYCNPESIEDIVNGMEKLAKNDIAPNQLINQANKFTWENTAAIVGEVMEKMLSNQR